MAWIVRYKILSLSGEIEVEARSRAISHARHLKRHGATELQVIDAESLQSLPLGLNVGAACAG
jgi:hypothetical protein